MRRRKESLLAWIPLIVSVVVSVIICCADYNSFLISGAEKGKLQLETLSIVSTLLIAAGVFICTYLLIDQREIEKNSNSKEIGHILIRNAYKECLETISVLDNTEMVKKYIIPKMDFNIVGDDKITRNIMNSPFENISDVISIASSGNVEGRTFDTFLEIQKEYKMVIRNQIVFFDIEEKSQTLEQIKLRDYIFKKKQDLCNKLINILIQEMQNA